MNMFSFLKRHKPQYEPEQQITLRERANIIRRHI
jgi:hypothetical protein